jgi:ribose transport system substrate-binding protein
MCLEAIKGANKVGKIKVVSFDEQDATLQGIKDGAVLGTVSPQPYQYGRHSVRILAGLARKDKTVLPPDGFLEVEIKVVKKDNVESFWEELKKLRQ